MRDYTTTRFLLKLSTLFIIILALSNDACGFSCSYKDVYLSKNVPNVYRSEQSFGYQQRHAVTNEIKLFAVSLDEESKEKEVKSWSRDQEIPWMNLPKTSYNLSMKDNSGVNTAEKEAGLRTEIIIGRMAMVGAIYLFSMEVLTGLSFPEQFNELVISLSL